MGIKKQTNTSQRWDEDLFKRHAITDPPRDPKYQEWDYIDSRKKHKFVDDQIARKFKLFNRGERNKSIVKAHDKADTKDIAGE